MVVLHPKEKEQGNDAAYLLSDLDVVLEVEPCIMCAMALLHSRVRRLFFAQRTPWGAIATQLHVSVCVSTPLFTLRSPLSTLLAMGPARTTPFAMQIHHQAGLNHRFLAYGGVAMSNL